MILFTAREWLWWGLQEFIDDHNNIIFEEDKTEEVSFEEKKQRGIFVGIFNSTKFKNIQKVYDSRALKWSKDKTAKIYEYYKLKLDFLTDRRNLYGPSIKKMT